LWATLLLKASKIKSVESAINELEKLLSENIGDSVKEKKTIV